MLDSLDGTVSVCWFVVSKLEPNPLNCWAGAAGEEGCVAVSGVEGCVDCGVLFVVCAEGGTGLEGDCDTPGADVAGVVFKVSCGAGFAGFLLVDKTW